MATKQDIPFTAADVDAVIGDGQRWFVGRSVDGVIRIAYRTDAVEEPVFVDLDPREAHQLGTILRRMAKKAREAEADLDAQIWASEHG